MMRTFSPLNYLPSRVDWLQEYAPEPLEAVAERLGLSATKLIKLDANENPYGPTTSAIKAIATFDEYHHYPDAISRKLRAAIAEYATVPAENVIVGNGSDELIDLTIRLFRPGPDGRGIGRLINCPPTFGMYEIYATANDLEVVTIPRRPDFALDMDRIEQVFAQDDSPAIIFVASPNNPDGKLLPDSDLARLLALPALIVLDEAYVEFADASRAPLVTEHTNLVVLRTFSKWAGLAGMRVGYGIYPDEIMPSLWRQKSPYNVNCAAQAAALATLDHLPEAFERLQLITEERERLWKALNDIDGLDALPSSTNFLLVKLVAASVADLRLQMESRGIMIRYYNSSDLDQYVRVSVGTPEQDDLLIEAFKAWGASV